MSSEALLILVCYGVTVFVTLVFSSCLSKLQNTVAMLAKAHAEFAEATVEAFRKLKGGS